MRTKDTLPAQKEHVYIECHFVTVSRSELRSVNSIEVLENIIYDEANRRNG